MITKNINEKYARYTGRKLLEGENAENVTEYAIDFFPSCKKNTYTANFLNNNTIKQKLGADLTIKHVSRNADLNYKWGDSIKIYQNEIKEFYEKKNFSSWLFSGTEDIACVTIGTLRIFHELNYTIKEKWKKWKVDDQVVGMEQTYDYGLKFITVKNAGHRVPQDQPKVAKILLDNYIKFIKENYNPNPTPEENKFPVWGTILLSVLLFVIILVIIIIIIRNRKGRVTDVDIEDNAKLLPSMEDR